VARSSATNPSDLRALATHAQRPLRKDAEQHRQQLLTAAVLVFNEQGLDASVTEIARVAGVGVGTLYRRFPPRKRSFDALVREILDTTIQMARDALKSPGGTGLERFLEASSAYQGRARGIPAATLEYRPRDGEDRPSTHRPTSRRREEARPDSPRPHQHRPVARMFSLLGVLEATLPVAPDAWRRHLDLLIAGMRPAASDLPHRALSPATLDQGSRTHKRHSFPE